MSRARQPGNRGYNEPTDPLERVPDLELPPKELRHLPVHEIVRRQAREWEELEENNEMLRDLTR